MISGTCCVCLYKVYIQFRMSDCQVKKNYLFVIALIQAYTRLGRINRTSLRMKVIGQPERAVSITQLKRIFPFQ